MKTKLAGSKAGKRTVARKNAETQKAVKKQTRIEKGNIAMSANNKKGKSSAAKAHKK